MKIAIYGNLKDQKSILCFNDLKVFLEQNSIDWRIEESSAHLLGIESKRTFKVLDPSYDFLVVIGGDGTVLKSILLVAEQDIPIVSINAGRLGFLSTISEPSIVPAFEHIISGAYKISKRMILSVKLSTPEQVLGFDTAYNFALNEVVLSKHDHEMVRVETYLNHRLLTSYWADGLIISTPTGSTAYSLACGGPLVSPESPVMTILPIAPHNLSMRPLVIPDDSELTFKVTSRASSFNLALDSRMFLVENEITVVVTKAHFPVKFVLPEGGPDFYYKISERLLWGEDKRN